MTAPGSKYEDLMEHGGTTGDIVGTNPDLQQRSIARYVVDVINRRQTKV